MNAVRKLGEARQLRDLAEPVLLSIHPLWGRLECRDRHSINELSSRRHLVEHFEHMLEKGPSCWDMLGSIVSSVCRRILYTDRPTYDWMNTV